MSDSESLPNYHVSWREIDQRQTTVCSEVTGHITLCNVVVRRWSRDKETIICLHVLSQEQGESSRGCRFAHALLMYL